MASEGGRESEEPVGENPSQASLYGGLGGGEGAARVSGAERGEARPSGIRAISLQFGGAGDDDHFRRDSVRSGRRRHSGVSGRSGRSGVSGRDEIHGVHVVPRGEVADEGKDSLTREQMADEENDEVGGGSGGGEGGGRRSNDGGRKASTKDTFVYHPNWGDVKGVVRMADTRSRWLPSSWHDLLHEFHRVGGTGGGDDGGGVVIL